MNSNSALLETDGVMKTRFHASLVFATTRSSCPPPCPSFISLFRHGSKVVNVAEIAVRKHEIVHNIEQTEKMIPFTMCENAFRLNVSELVFGIDTLDSYFWVPVGSIQEPIEYNSVSSGYVSHRRTSVQCPQKDKA